MWPGADLPGRRIFIATPLADAAVDAVAALVQQVREAGVSGSGRDVRWVRLDGLHLTLRFLGPTLDDRIELARAAVRAAGAQGRPFDITIGGAGTFPSDRRPRALWLGLRAGGSELSELASTVNGALADGGWPAEAKPFQAHLTLARSDGVSAGAQVASRLIEAASDLRIHSRIDQLGLFESLTGGGPARYEPIEMVGLG